ncbi:IMP dehydrogenase [Candidatus Uhrbacteria bacterium]|nr:IMP dehydrogenase [Candidatus Uhrbacteria bacterium]
MPELLFNAEHFPKLTPQDVFLFTTNPIEAKLEECASSQEREKLSHLRSTSYEAEGQSLQWFQGNGQWNEKLQELARDARTKYRKWIRTLEGRYPNVKPPSSRKSVDLHSIDGSANLPFVLSNMDKVTGVRSGRSATRAGGWAAWPQSKPPMKTEHYIKDTKKLDARYLEPVHLTPASTIGEARRYFAKRGMDTAVISDANGKLLTLMKRELVPDAADEDAEIASFLRGKNGRVVTLRYGKEPGDAIDLMKREHRHFLPIVDGQKKTRGVITRESAEMYYRFPPNVDQEGRLKTLVAVSAFRKNVYKRVKELIAWGVDGIVLDSPHLDQGTDYEDIIRNVRKMIDESGRKILLVAGNVIDPDAAKNAIAAGAHCVKVGIGPGAVCTTRDETGVGEPQWSAVYDCAKAARSLGGFVWADGGVRLPGDAAKLLAAGASQVMIGTIAAGTYDSPGPILQHGNERYVEHYGMGSDLAFGLREDVDEDDVEEMLYIGRPSEGLRSAKVMVYPDMDTIFKQFRRFAYGAKSMGTFLGAWTLEQAIRFARFGVQTTSGYQEGKGKPVV